VIDDLCPYGSDLNSSHCLLRDCRLLATHRARLLVSAVGDIHSSEFMINPKNLHPLCKFLRETGMGHTKQFCFDWNPYTIDDDEIDHSDSPEPDFGVFEP